MEEGKCLLDVINDPAALDDFLTSDRLGASVGQHQLVSAFCDGSIAQQPNLQGVNQRPVQNSQLVLQVSHAATAGQFAPTVAVAGGSTNQLGSHVMLKSGQQIPFQTLMPSQQHVSLDQQQNVSHVSTASESSLAAQLSSAGVGANRIVIQNQSPSQIQTISVAGNQDMKFLPVNSVQNMYNGNQLARLQPQNAVANANSFAKSSSNAVTFQPAVRHVGSGTQNIELVRLPSVQNMVVQNQSNTTQPAMVQAQQAQTVLVRAQLNGQQVYFNLPVSQLQNQGKLVVPNITLGAPTGLDAKMQPVVSMQTVVQQQQVTNGSIAGSNSLMQNHVVNSQASAPNVQAVGQFLIASKKAPDLAPNAHPMASVQHVAVGPNSNSPLLYEQLKLPKQNYKQGALQSHGVMLQNTLPGSKPGSLSLQTRESTICQPAATVQHFAASQSGSGTVQQPVITSSTFYSAVSPSSVPSISTSSQNGATVPQYAVIHQPASNQQISVQQASPYMVIQPSAQTVATQQPVGQTAQSQTSQVAKPGQILMHQGQKLLLGTPRPQMIVQGKHGVQSGVVLQHGPAAAVQVVATDQLNQLPNTNQQQTNFQTVQQAVPTLAPKPAPGQKIQTIQLTPQNQQMLQKVQVHIRGLLSLKEPTDQQKQLLHQLFNIQQTIINQGREAAIQSGIAQSQMQQSVATDPTSGSQETNLSHVSSAGMTLAPAKYGEPSVASVKSSVQNTNLTNLLKRPVPIAIKPGTRSSVTSASLNTVATNPAAAMQAEMPALAPAGTTNASSVTGFPSKIRIGNQIVHVPPVLQEQLRQLQEHLKTLPLDQQNALVEKQKLLSKGGPALASLMQFAAMKPVVSGSSTAVPAQCTAEASKGMKRPGSTTARTPLLKVARLQQQLTKDQNLCTKPTSHSCQTPFRSVKDACKQLLRHHLFTSRSPELEDLTEEDEKFNDISVSLLQKKDAMVQVFHNLLMQESQRDTPSWEQVMLKRLLVRQEKEQLKLEREAAQNGEFVVPEGLQEKIEALRQQLEEATGAETHLTKSDPERNVGLSGHFSLGVPSGFQKTESGSSFGNTEGSPSNTVSRESFVTSCGIVKPESKEIYTEPTVTSKSADSKTLVESLNYSSSVDYSLPTSSFASTYCGSDNLIVQNTVSAPVLCTVPVTVNSPGIVPESDVDFYKDSESYKQNGNKIDVPLSLESIIQQTLSDEDSFVDSDTYYFESAVSAGDTSMSCNQTRPDGSTKDLAPVICDGNNIDINHTNHQVSSEGEKLQNHNESSVSEGGHEKDILDSKVEVQEKYSHIMPSRAEPQSKEVEESGFASDLQEEYCDNVSSCNADSHRNLFDNFLEEQEDTCNYSSLNGIHVPEEGFQEQESASIDGESLDESQAAVQTLLLTHPSLDIVDYSSEYMDSCYGYMQTEYKESMQQVGSKESSTSESVQRNDETQVILNGCHSKEIVDCIPNHVADTNSVDELEEVEMRQQTMDAVSSILAMDEMNTDYADQVQHKLYEPTDYVNYGESESDYVRSNNPSDYNVNMYENGNDNFSVETNYSTSDCTYHDTDDQIDNNGALELSDQGDAELNQAIGSILS